MARLHDKQDKLTVTNYLRFAKNAKLTVVNSDGTTTEISLAELANLDPANRLVTITATGSITAAANESRINLLGEVGGDAAVTLTLPAATGSGARYHFKVSVVNTSNYVIKVADATDTIDGSIVSLQDAADTVVGWETAATTDTITLNGTTTGGVSIGDWFELVDIASNQWTVTGTTTSSGTEATPFSATVS